MEVYVITIDEVYDYETYNHTPRVFKNRKDAQEEFDAIVAEAKKDAAQDGWVESQGASYYEAYPDGWYGTSHYCVSLIATQLR